MNILKMNSERIIESLLKISFFKCHADKDKNFNNGVVC